ncbi:MAG: hypothetical protein LCH43_10815 [Actinobacteria bacterium]|nr:hypothetical protein [Actinomycetota bacterium]
MGQGWGLAALSVIAIAVMIAAIMVVYSRMLPAGAPIGVSLACVAVGTVTWLAVTIILRPALPAELVAPIAALGGLAALLATIVPRAFGAGAPGSVAFAAIWSVLVFVPVAWLSFSGLGPFGVRPIDQGGSLAINVAAGAAAVGVLVSGGAGAPPLRPSAVPRGFATVGVILLTLGWIGWLVGAELAIDDLTPGILINGAFAAGGGVVGWLVVQRIRHQSTTLSAVAAGIVSGLVGVSAGAPMYGAPAAFVVGIIASASACLFTLRRVGDTRRQQWFIVGSHLIAGAVGLVALGLFANDLGFLFTGQYVFVRDQVICCILVAGWSMGVAALLWLVLRRRGDRMPRSA